MPQYEDLVRRALAAGAIAQGLQLESKRLRGLAQILRDAKAGRVHLARCAWCDGFKVEDEWLQLEAIGHGQQQIASSLREQATHGICPQCFERVQGEADHARASSQT